MYTDCPFWIFFCEDGALGLAYSLPEPSNEMEF